MAAAMISKVSTTQPNGSSMSPESLEFWKGVFEIAGVVLLLLTFFAGAGVLWFSRKVNEVQASQLRQFDEALTDAKTELGKQQERAAKAEEETEKLKQVVAWRVLPSGSAAEVEKVLSSRPGAVNLRYTDGDPEALFLAIQVSQILGKAKWKIAPGAVKFDNAVLFGIALPDSKGADAATLREGFMSANIPFSDKPLPAAGVSFSISTIPGAPTLMIGSM